MCPSGSFTIKVEAPHLSQCLEKRNAGGLEFEEELLDLRVRMHRHIGRQQALPISQLRVHDRGIDTSEVEPTCVSSDLRVERRLSVDEYSLPPELLRKKITRCLDIGNK